MYIIIHEFFIAVMLTLEIMPLQSPPVFDPWCCQTGFLVFFLYSETIVLIFLMKIKTLQNLFQREVLFCKSTLTPGSFTLKKTSIFLSLFIYMIKILVQMTDIFYIFSKVEIKLNIKMTLNR